MTQVRISDRGQLGGSWSEFAGTKSLQLSFDGRFFVYQVDSFCVVHGTSWYMFCMQWMSMQKP